MDIDNISRELLNKLINDKRFMEEKSCIEWCLNEPHLERAYLTIKRKHFPILQKMFPNHLVPMYPSLDESEIVKLKTFELSPLQEDLQKDFPKSKIALRVPSLEKVKMPSFEECLSDETTTMEEQRILHHAQNMLSVMRDESCEPDEISVVFHNHN